MTFSDTLAVILPFSLLPLCLSSCPYLSRAHLFPFPQSDHTYLLFPSLLLLHLPLQQWSLFSFLVSEVTSGYVFTSKDLELGASDEGAIRYLFFWAGLFHSVWFFLVCSFTGLDFGEGSRLSIKKKDHPLHSFLHVSFPLKQNKQQLCACVCDCVSVCLCLWFYACV